MENALAKAKTYRDRAEEIRAIASMARNPETQQMLIKAANGYDRMAEHMIVLAAAKPEPVPESRP